MGKALYIGDNSYKARKVKKIYIGGSDGKAHKVKKYMLEMQMELLDWHGAVEYLHLHGQQCHLLIRDMIGLIMVQNF